MSRYLCQPVNLCMCVNTCQGFLLSGGMLSAVFFRDFGAYLEQWSRIDMWKVVS